MPRPFIASSKPRSSTLPSSVERLLPCATPRRSPGKRAAALAELVEVRELGRVARSTRRRKAVVARRRARRRRGRGRAGWRGRTRRCRLRTWKAAPPRSAASAAPDGLAHAAAGEPPEARGRAEAELGDGGHVEQHVEQRARDDAALDGRDDDRDAGACRARGVRRRARARRRSARPRARRRCAARRRSASSAKRRASARIAGDADASAARRTCAHAAWRVAARVSRSKGEGVETRLVALPRPSVSPLSALQRGTSPGKASREALLRARLQEPCRTQPPRRRPKSPGRRRRARSGARSRDRVAGHTLRAENR